MEGVRVGSAEFHFSALRPFLLFFTKKELSENSPKNQKKFFKKKLDKTVLCVIIRIMTMLYGLLRFYTELVFSTTKAR